MDAIFHLWVYLAAQPLFGLASTLGAYVVASAISKRSGGHPLASPVLVSIVLIAILLRATGTSYAAYFGGAQYVHFLLGPATVALAVPMYANLPIMRRHARAILPALAAGSMAAAISAMAIARLFGAPREVVLSLAPKSVTTPIAMAVAERIGGQPSLATIFVLLTGLTAIVLGPPVMRLMRVRDWPAWGLAAGTAGHGLATARALVLSEQAGAFAGLAIGLNGVLTALLVPVLAPLVAG